LRRRVPWCAHTQLTATTRSLSLEEVVKVVASAVLLISLYTTLARNRSLIFVIHCISWGKYIRIKARAFRILFRVIHISIKYIFKTFSI
ncbi:MAG: hypothetical protein NWE86_04585, partial [Candidatus Bathyarchaeota archaeon]|nr:hypothetical protein [Candidatus Bathyarchaeota archaeon]